MTTTDDSAWFEAEFARTPLMAILRGNGFRVRTRRSYGSLRLPSGHVLYIAEQRRVAK